MNSFFNISWELKVHELDADCHQYSVPKDIIKSDFSIYD